jgi:hypothetical protein
MSGNPTYQELAASAGPIAGDKAIYHQQVAQGFRRFGNTISAYLQHHAQYRMVPLPHAVR